MRALKRLACPQSFLEIVAGMARSYRRRSRDGHPAPAAGSKSTGPLVGPVLIS